MCFVIHKVVNIYNYLRLLLITLSAINSFTFKFCWFRIIYNYLQRGKYVPFPPIVVPLSAINWRSYNIQAALRWVHPLSTDNNIELQTTFSRQIETNTNWNTNNNTNTLYLQITLYRVANQDHYHTKILKQMRQKWNKNNVFFRHFWFNSSLARLFQGWVI